MSAPRTPDYLVERLRAGDLPPEEAARVRARLEAEGGLGRLAALERDGARFLEARPPGPALGEIRRRAARGARPPRAPRRLLALVPALAVALLAAALASRLFPAAVVSPHDALEITREKGARPHLVVHRQRAAAAAERLAPGAEARAGEALMVSYVAAGAAHGVVVSIDGRGGVTLHLPEAPGPAAALAPRGEVPLPHAYVLDDAPAFERFFLVTSAAPFEAAPVVEAARALAASGDARGGPLALPAGLAQADLLLVKATR